MVGNQDVAEVIRLVFETCWEEFYLGQPHEPDVAGLPARMKEQGMAFRETQMDSLMELDCISDSGEYSDNGAGYSGPAFDGETDVVVEPDMIRPLSLGTRSESAATLPSLGSRKAPDRWENGSKSGSRVIWVYRPDGTIDSRPLQCVTSYHPAVAPRMARKAKLAVAASAPGLSITGPPRKLAPPLKRPHSESTVHTARPSSRPPKGQTLAKAPPRRGKPVQAVPGYTFCVPIPESFWVLDEEVMPFLPTMPEEFEGKFNYDTYGEKLYSGKYAWMEKGRDPDLDIILTETLKRLLSPVHMGKLQPPFRALTTAEIESSGILPQKIASIEGWEEVRDLPNFPRGGLKLRGTRVSKRKGICVESSGEDELDLQSSIRKRRNSSGSSTSNLERSKLRGRVRARSEESAEDEGQLYRPDRDDLFKPRQTLRSSGVLLPPLQGSGVISSGSARSQDAGAAEYKDFDELMCPNAACREFGCALHIRDAKLFIFPSANVPVPLKSSRRILEMGPNRCSIECWYLSSSRLPPSSESLDVIGPDDRLNLLFLLDGIREGRGPQTVCDLTLMLGTDAAAPSSPETGKLQRPAESPTCFQVGHYIRGLFAVPKSDDPLGFTPPRPALKQRQDGALLGLSPGRPIVPFRPRPAGKRKSDKLIFDLDPLHMEPVEQCHHEGSCDAQSNCRCFVANIHCERECLCGPECVRRHPGCKCKAAAGNRRARPCSDGGRCRCQRDGRECDPEKCGPCGADHADPYPSDPNIAKTSPPGLCTNVCIQSGHHQPLRVGVSPVSGYGLFAAGPIKKGAMILEYIGELLHQNEGARRGMVYAVKDRNYLFDLNHSFHIDAAGRGNVGRYINGGTEATNNVTCYIKHVQGNHRIAVFAGRDIKAGEELLYDYGEHFNLKTSSQAKSGPTPHNSHPSSSHPGTAKRKPSVTGRPVGGNTDQGRPVGYSTRSRR